MAAARGAGGGGSQDGPVSFPDRFARQRRGFYGELLVSVREQSLFRHG